LILYKYMSFDVARQVLESGALQFSRCNRFNDPFDSPRYPRQGDDSIRGNLTRITREIGWRENIGLLCLTRTPTNPLMWAHYAASHEGVVIGIDVEQAGFTDPASNFIPAQFGSIVYVSRRPNWGYFSGEEPGPAGTTFAFQASNFERLQRLFLTKPIHWAYEEEVRVAKCIHGMSQEGDHQTASGAWTVTGAGKNARHLFRAPAESFREVHFGFRTDIEACDTLREDMSHAYPDLKWLECTLGLDTFDVLPRDHVTLAEVMDI
jgi:hypothetical protein